MLLRMLEQLMRRAGSPIAQTTLATESGMANNTVALGYLELLSDLLVLGTSEPWDPNRKVRVSRKASKYPFINLLATNTWWTKRYTTPAALETAPGEEKGVWWEWAVAAELFRRAAKAGDPTPTLSRYWRSDAHEIDFVRTGKPWIEVKAGKTSPLEFGWFVKAFPREQLLVVNSERFQSDRVRGVTLEGFLLDETLWRRRSGVALRNASDDPKPRFKLVAGSALGRGRRPRVRFQGCRSQRRGRARLRRRCCLW
ncbi:MAG TPA: hypothetical protein VIL32_08145 [Steroidobacteraceae bacterium]